MMRINNSTRQFVILSLLSFSFASTLMADSIATTIEQSQVKGGVVAVLNSGDAVEFTALAENDAYVLHALESDPATVNAMRAALQEKKRYGPISVALFDGATLPYADNIVDLIIADSLGNVTQEEALRALAPLGVLMVGGVRTVKPWPTDIDDWPQYLNKADNNAVAMDSVIGPPRRLQWSGDLVWGRSHMAIATTVSMVTANGRLFSIEDRALPENPFLPTDFYIVARSAFNGKKLWMKKISTWESITMYIKCLPAQQQRRMAAIGDTLYCTFELEGAVSAVDATTGDVIKTYEGTSPCQEVAFDDGILFLNVGERFPSAAYNITKGGIEGGATPGEPFLGSGFSAGYDPEITDSTSPKSVIIAIDPETGDHLWSTPELNKYTAATMSIKGDYLVYQTEDGLFCHNAKTGVENWAISNSVANAVGHDSKTPGTMPNTVVIGDTEVFVIEPNGEPPVKPASAPNNIVTAYNLADKTLLWSAPSKGNYESSSDVFYIDGVLWVGGAGVPTAYNAKTGALIGDINQKTGKPMGHDRCYRNMITKNYYINSKTGGADFLRLTDKKEFPNHWTRGGCGMGILPANGLLYSTPYSCSCSSGAMFPGLNAYAAVPGLENSADPVPINRTVQLETGPAYRQFGAFASINDWATYRCNPSRSGVSQTKVSATLNPRWNLKLTGVPTATISVGKQVYVCDTDAHTVHSVEVSTGKINWTFTAEGRIDSPPTYRKGMLFFGSHDGWLYCVRASDGALAWRFKDLPKRLILIKDQLESAWPVMGSVLIIKNYVYFAAGRSTFLDGGIFLYKLNVKTGALVKSRVIYGPFGGNGFPVASKGTVEGNGFKNDLLIFDGERIYLHNRPLDLELNDATGPQLHVMPMGGFLDSHVQYRMGWIVQSEVDWWQKNVKNILVAEGDACYSIGGFHLGGKPNHSYFDPRQGSYKLQFGSSQAMFDGTTDPEDWSVNIPINGKAMAKAGSVVFVAGNPMDLDDLSFTNYENSYKGKLGGRLLAASAENGKILADYTLSAAPVWDSIAVANGHLFISLKDGSLQCFNLYNEGAGGDIDLDGLPDAWEAEHFGDSTNGNPNAASLNGINNVGQSYIADLDPNDPSARFMVSDLSPTASGNVLQWQAAPGRVYNIQWSSNLVSGFEVAPFATGISGGGYTDTVHRVDGESYYRIEAELAP